MDYRLITILSILTILIATFSGCLGDESQESNLQPLLSIEYPLNNQIVHQLVMISGTATEKDADKEIQYIEIQINDQP